MRKNIKNIIKTSLFLCAGSFVLYSCETDADQLGSQFFEGTSAQGEQVAYDIITYNVSNNDTIRTDASKLTYATLGAFNENQFGLQKSSFVSQVRLSSYNPSFGTSPVIDSVVMEFKPLYASDTVTTSTDENYTYSDEKIPAKKVVNTYPISKYGKTNSTMTLQVYEVDDYLGSYNDEVYSNKSVSYSTLLGEKNLTGTVSSVAITKDSDNSSLLSRDAAVRIPLDASFFQSKIMNKQGQAELADAASFIRYFKGIRLSVKENDGYIMRFTPNDTKITIYYKNSDSTTPATLELSMGAGSAKYNQIEYDRTGTPLASLSSTPNYTNGDAKIYAQGMGGPSIGVRIPAEKIAEIRTLYNQNKIGIISAKVRLYVDNSVWNNTYAKPQTFTAAYYTPSTKTADLSAFIKDMTTLSASGFYSLLTTNFTSTPAYYDVSITQTLKDVVEKSAENKDIVLSIGDYSVSTTTGAYLGQNYNTKAYTPNRVVFVGTDATNQYRSQLNIVYTKK